MGSNDDLDILTGYKNKAAFEKYTDTIEHDERYADAPFGVFYTDINDLKHYMNYFSLRMGDLQIRKTAVFIQEALECWGEYFRVGGDEFVVILPFFDKGKFGRYICKMDELKKKMENSDVISFAAGSCHVTSGKDIRTALRMAFEQMKADKERYHAEHPK